MDNSKLLCAWVSGYLTTEAQAMVDRLMSKGIDQDLAFAIVESQMPEVDIYELPSPKRDPWTE